MPVPNPGPKVGSDSLKVKFLMIFGRPKTRFFGQISGAPGYISPIPASYQPRRFNFGPLDHNKALYKSTSAADGFPKGFVLPPPPHPGPFRFQVLSILFFSAAVILQGSPTTPDLSNLVRLFSQNKPCPVSLHPLRTQEG